MVNIRSQSNDHFRLKRRKQTISFGDEIFDSPDVIFDQELIKTYKPVFKVITSAKLVYTVHMKLLFSIMNLYLQKIWIRRSCQVKFISNSISYQMTMEVLLILHCHKWIYNLYNTSSTVTALFPTNIRISNYSLE